VGLLPQGFIAKKRVPVGKLTTEVVENGHGIGGSKSGKVCTTTTPHTNHTF